MAEIIYTGDAPALAQKQRYFLSGTPGEQATVLATIGRKTLRASGTTERAGSDDTLEDLIDALVAAWNSSTLPEFQEVTAAKGENSLGTPYFELEADNPGVPFEVTLTNPAPTVDVDTTTEGSDGDPAITIVTVKNGKAAASDEVWLLITAIVASTDLTVTIIGSEAPSQTITIASNATAAAVQSALEALTTIGTGNVSVLGGSPGASTTGNYYIRFQGVLSGSNLLLSCTGEATAQRIYQGGLAVQNEIQILTHDHTGGTMTLTYSGQTTSALDFDATAGEIQTALRALSNIAEGDVVVYGVDTAGASLAQVWGIMFVGALANTNVAAITVNAGSLTGGSAAAIATSVDGGTPSSENEVQRIYSNGNAGSLILSFDDEETSPIPYNASAGVVQAALEGLSTIGNGNITVTGAGTATNPWVVTFVITLAATDVEQIEGDVNTLTAAGTNEVQRVRFTASGGTLIYSFNGFSTAAIAYNASTGTLQTALEGLESIGTGNVAVTGSAGEYIITFQGDLASEDVEQIQIDTTSLTGSTTVTITTVVVQASRGPYHWDDPLNWRNLASGVKGIPVTGDDVFLETGDNSRCLLYGLDQNAVNLNSLNIHSKFERRAWIGLPMNNSAGYDEYRQRYLKIGFQGTRKLYIGEGKGGGCSRIQINAQATQVDIRVIRTAGQESDQDCAFLFIGTHASNVLNICGTCVVGLALDPGTSAVFASIAIRDGELILGEGCTVGAGSGRVIDHTGGRIDIRDAVINGDVFSSV